MKRFHPVPESAIMMEAPTPSAADMNTSNNNQDNGYNVPRVGLLSHTFRALSHRNYLLYFIGQLISLIGTWMQFIALPWLVYSFPGATPFLLGMVGFTGQIPGFLMSPFGGVVADRFNRRRVLLFTQTLAMLQAFALAVLVLTGHVKIWQVMLLSAFVGIVNAFDMPVRQAFVVELTENKEALSNAIALNSSMFNGARLFGPWVAGLLIAKVGTGWCFFINGCSFLAVLACLLAMRINGRHTARSGRPVFSTLRDGFAYAISYPPIKWTVLLLFVISLVGMPYMVLMPVFAKKVLHGGPSTFGFLVGSSGIGALTGALFLASRRSVLGLGKMIPIAAAIFGAGLVAFSWSRNVGLSCAVLALTGFGMIVQMAASNTIIQTVVDEDKRGRVMSIYTMAFLGAAPFGSLLAGVVANRLGPSITVTIGGIASILAAAFFATKLPSIRLHARPAYVRLGIIPGVMEETPQAMSSDDADPSG